MIKIAMIEDDLELAEVLSLYLKQFNIEVVNFEEPFLALSSLKLQKFDLLILDLTLPEIDGLELTKRIRRIFPKDELSVIIVSNDPCKKIPTKFLKYGANDFLYKGFSNEEFFARINSNIEILELFEEIKNKALSTWSISMIFLSFSSYIITVSKIP